MRSTTLAAPLLLECQRAILERDAWPLLRVELPGATAAASTRHARDCHLDDFPEVAYAEAKQANASARRSRRRRTRARSRGSTRRAWRARRGRASRCASRRSGGAGARRSGRRRRGAQQAGMALADFEAFVERALFLDRADPVAAWGELHDFQEALIERLRGARELRIEADGTDLTLGVKGRTWVNSDGRRNMPSGEVFTGPLEDSANGRIRFASRRRRPASTSRASTSSSATALSSRRRPSAARSTSSARWRPTTARAASARSASARTSASTARSARSSSTRRSAAPSTSRSGAPIRRPAARTSPRCTGT